MSFLPRLTVRISGAKQRCAASLLSVRLHARVMRGAARTENRTAMHPSPPPYARARRPQAAGVSREHRSRCARLPTKREYPDRHKRATAVSMLPGAAFGAKPLACGFRDQLDCHAAYWTDLGCSPRPQTHGVPSPPTFPKDGLRISAPASAGAQSLDASTCGTNDPSISVGSVAATAWETLPHMATGLTHNDRDNPPDNSKRSAAVGRSGSLRG